MSFALGLTGNRAEAEDACQEMVLQMLRHLDRIEENSNLKSWVFPYFTGSAWTSSGNAGVF